MSTSSTLTPAQQRYTKLVDRAIDRQSKLAEKITALDDKIRMRGGKKMLADDGPNPRAFNYDAKTDFMHNEIFRMIVSEQAIIQEALSAIEGVGKTPGEYYSRQKERLMMRSGELAELRSKYRP